MTIDQQIEQLKKITREDDVKKYMDAQFRLAIIYYLGKNDIEQAEICLLKIDKQANPAAYAQAQCNLGQIYEYDKKDIKQAELYYNHVERQDDAQAYARAQCKLGQIYQIDKKDIKQAELYYNKVEREDDAQAYAQAQCNLGVIYQYDKKDIKQAELYYNKVEREDDAEAYAQAQCKLGRIYEYDKYDKKQAELYYNKVKREDNAQAYAQAQFLLGRIYQDKKNAPEKAYKAFSQCCNSNNPVIFNLANCAVGDCVYFDQISTNSKPESESAKTYYQNVNYVSELFGNFVIAQIMLAVSNIEENDLFKTRERRDDLVIKPICQIRKLTEEIQQQLLVTFKLGKSKSKPAQQFERRVAHYTNPNVLFQLLKNDSHVRLNVVDFMNDPTENQVLSNWLGMNNDPNSEIKSFLASFTFNHNCLNQFRLYGNENNIIGSGVSLVFNQSFFGNNVESSINPDSVALLSYDTKAKVAKSDSEENKDDGDSNNICFLEPLPLFRCLYFDPNSEYISIAKRNKFSFYLEHQGSLAKTIDDEWNNYINLLDEENKIAKITKNLKEIKKLIRKLRTKKNLKAFSNLDQLINLAIMPISCLIKHAAFEDEDECRMIYITHIADKKIQAPKEYGDANSLFVNYGQEVEDYLDKIYLGPQCQPHHKLWITNHVRTPKSKSRLKLIKVVQSEMPLR